jgi:F-type H+-transporting ATPase subunit epsilon
MMHLRIITPKKVVREMDIASITAPGAEGEMTVLPHHVHTFALLKEGIVTIRTAKEEESIGIGSGYLETNGKELNLLVTRAYGQDEIDEKLTAQAVKDAEAILAKSHDKKERLEATSLLRRSNIDMRLIKRKRKI